VTVQNDPYQIEPNICTHWELVKIWKRILHLLWTYKLRREEYFVHIVKLLNYRTKYFVDTVNLPCYRTAYFVHIADLPSYRTKYFVHTANLPRRRPEYFVHSEFTKLWKRIYHALDLPKYVTEYFVHTVNLPSCRTEYFVHTVNVWIHLLLECDSHTMFFTVHLIIWIVLIRIRPSHIWSVLFTSYWHTKWLSWNLVDSKCLQLVQSWLNTVQVHQQY
jgi:hypothetical protein